MDPVQCKANYSRVCQLLVDKGGDALRAALHVVHPPSTLAAVLNANKSVLKKIRYSVINPSQWNLLYPVSGTPDSRNFDVTLLTILLRNICGLSSPPAGWNVMPSISDTSISANIARIKIFRNEVYGHTPSAQLDDTTFETLWQEISKPLVKLGIPQQDIDELKEAPLSSDEESYIKKLKEWKKLEDDLLSTLNDLEIGIRSVENQVVNVENQVVNVENQVVEIRKIVENPVPSQVDQLAKFDFTGKIDGLCELFQDDTRQWFFQKLSSWFCDKQSRVMILTAGPGVGKSVLSAKVCDAYKQSGRLAAYHFCDFRSSDSRNPNRILQSLASQMCENVKGFRDKLSKVLRREHSRGSMSDAFRVLLNDPLHACRTWIGSRKPMLIVVDGLDESKTDDKSEFLELISNEFAQLPKWIKMLLSSRPELQVRNKLQRLKPLEILPDDHNHNRDLKHFILHCLPDLSEDNVRSLILKCEGSFLYAYYLVNELKEMDLGIEPNLSGYVPKGISGFYEKQFKRLKTGLQHYNSETWSSILKGFLNVIAASSYREPLPIRILLTCIGLSGVVYEIRDTIIGIMSEILSVYEDCVTVYHKSLWDWLTLDGYEEHAFVGNVADGIKRLWQACKGIYSDIASLRSVSDFQISPEIRYALENGGKYLLDVGDAEDFHWLLNVRLNFLKLKFYGSLNVEIEVILKAYKAKRPGYHHWGNIHLRNLLISMRPNRRILSFTDYLIFFDRNPHGDKKREIYYIYLQSLASGCFDFDQKTIDCKNEARAILDATNELWIEEIGKEYNSDFKIISHIFMRTDKASWSESDAIALSPDNKLLAYKDGRKVEVFKLPSLIVVFELEISVLNNPSSFLIFSPDSSYLLWDSIRSCVSLREQKEVPLIPHGPESVNCCSFSSCGMKLVSTLGTLLQVWDVKKKRLVVQVEIGFSVTYCFLSSCSSYIVLTTIVLDDIVVLKSKTLEKININQISCADTCLTDACYQTISPSFWDHDTFKYYFRVNAKFSIRHFHLPSGEIFLSANKHCSNPFTWKDRKCVIFMIQRRPPLAVVYDFIKREVVEYFDFGCLLTNTCVRCISKLDETNLFVCLGDSEVFVLEYEPPTNSSVTPFASGSDTKCYALSPDKLYLACCDKDRSLTIRSVDSGKALQVVALKQPPISCWWSELYLWVVCKGAVVKYLYDSTRTKMLGNYLEECAINFKKVLKFADGVLVIRLSDNGEISISKIRNQKIYPQQIPNSSFAATSVAISSDGCAVLLYRKSCSDYQLWEVACEDTWEVRLTGKIDGFQRVSWFCLTGTENSRSSIWLTHRISCSNVVRIEPHDISSIDFPSCQRSDLHELPLSFLSVVVYADSNSLIMHQDKWIHFVNVSTGEIITSLYVGHDVASLDVSSFYIPSRGILVLGGRRYANFFKIHNIENNLPF